MRTAVKDGGDGAAAPQKQQLAWQYLCGRRRRRRRRRSRGLMNDDNRSTECVCNFVVSTARLPFAYQVGQRFCFGGFVSLMWNLECMNQKFFKAPFFKCL